MQLIVITPEEDRINETDVVNALFAGGLQRLHLRKPSYSTANYKDYIRKIDARYHSRMVLNGSFELFGEFELGGMHLGRTTRDNKDIGRLVAALSPSFISTSFHSWQEVRESELPYRYVFISPVFDSISKKDYKANIDLTQASQIKQERINKHKYCPKIIGLGGIGAEQIAPLHNNGFDGAALLGGIWQAENPVAAFENMLRITRSLAGH